MSIVPVLILCGLIITVVFYTLRNRSAPMPSSPGSLLLIERALHDLSCDTGGARIYDLGSGWGNAVLRISKRYPEVRVCGIENSPLPYAVSLVLKVMLRRKNLRLIYRNFFRVDIKDADAVICYLDPAQSAGVEKKILSECREDTAVISNFFSLPGLTRIKEYRTRDIWGTGILVYRSRPLRKIQKVSGINTTHHSHPHPHPLKQNRGVH
ncbi:MAG: hypothetical protein ACOCSE_02750 [Chitinivibrionales bacterium]